MKKRGFTLIEMLIVIIIIGILAATLIPRIGNARNRANDTARIADIKSIATAAIWYSMDNGEFSDTTSDYEGADYGLAKWPTDPVNNGEYVYSFTTTDEDKHFIACAKMSEGSKAGNTSSNLATIENIDYDTAIADLGNGTDYHCYVG